MTETGTQAGAGPRPRVGCRAACSASRLGRSRRADLAARIDAYRRGTDPLSVPVAILGHAVPR